MQKLNKKASLLLWAFFLSAIISIAFISISSKISKNLQEENVIFLEEANKIYNNIEYLNNKEKKEYIFTETATWTIKILEWIVLAYTWSKNNWIRISTWASISVSWTLNIENLAWKSSFKINSNKNFTKQENSYNEIEQVWNKNLIKSRNIIKND